MRRQQRCGVPASAPVSSPHVALVVTLQHLPAHAPAPRDRPPGAREGPFTCETGTLGVTAKANNPTQASPIQLCRVSIELPAMLKGYTAPNLPSSVVHWRRAPTRTIMGAIYEAPAIVALGPTWSESPQASRSFGSAKSTSHQQVRCTCNRSEATNDDAILNSWR